MSSAGRSLHSSLYDESLYVLGELYAFFIAAFIVLDGRLDYGRFAAGLRKTLDTYPILKSLFAPGAFRSRWEVQADPDVDSIVERHEIGGEDIERQISELKKRFINRKISVTRELPLRFLIIETGAKTHVGMVIHHALADGRGAIEILKALKAAEDGTLPEGPIVCDRGVKQLFRNYGFREKLRIAGVMASQFIEEAKAPPVTPLAMNTGGDEGDVAFDRIVLPPWELEKIHAFSHSKNATVNDVLLSAVLKAYNDFNAAREKNSGIYGLGIAVDLRGAAGIEGGIANLSGLLGIPVDSGAAADPLRLLDAISERTKLEKNRYPGLFYLTVLGIMNTIMPAGLLRAAFRKIFVEMIHRLGVPSALTNIGVIPGELEKMWGLDVEDMFLLAPVIERPSAIFTATTFKGGLSLTTGYRESGLGPHESAEFQKLIRDCLKFYEG